MTFFKNDLAPHGIWRVLSSWWPVLALLKSQNAFKMGCFATKNGSKMGQKSVFPKMILDHLGCLNKWDEPILSPFWGILAPPKSQNALKMGCFATKKMGQKWVKEVFFQKLFQTLWGA